MAEILTSLHGRRIGLDKDGNLIIEGARIQFNVSRVVNLTAATLAVTSDLHEGRTITVNRAAGSTLTLPAATGSGAKYRILVGTAQSGGSLVVQVVGDDTMTGLALIAADGGSTVNGWETAADSDTITMDGTTRGGLKGDLIELEDMAADTWSVQIRAAATGAEATPFSAAVS